MERNEKMRQSENERGGDNTEGDSGSWKGADAGKKEFFYSE